MGGWNRLPFEFDMLDPLDWQSDNRVDVVLSFFLGIVRTASSKRIEPNNFFPPLGLQQFQLLPLFVDIPINGTPPDILCRLLDIESFVDPQNSPVSVDLLNCHVVVLFEAKSLVIPQFIAPEET